MKREEDELIEVGRFGRPHGLSGEISLIPHNPKSTVLEGFASRLPRKRPKCRASETLDEDGKATPPPAALYLEDGSRLRISSIRHAASGRYVLKLEGVGERDSAAGLTGHPVYVRREDMPEVEEGWYLTDLIGLEVFDEQGRLLGWVEGVLPTGGVDVLEVEGELGAWMLPAADEFIVEVDLPGNRITVAPPDGLLPLADED